MHVLTRSAAARQLALQLGASSTGVLTTPHPSPLIPPSCSPPWAPSFHPPWRLSIGGGTLAIAGIYLTDIPTLNYERHLFEERTLCSVTANTRHDGDEFLEVAARVGLRVSTTPYPFDRADQALADLAHDDVNGAAVLTLARE